VANLRNREALSEVMRSQRRWTDVFLRPRAIGIRMHAKRASYKHDMGCLCSRQCHQAFSQRDCFRHCAFVQLTKLNYCL